MAKKPTCTVCGKEIKKAITFDGKKFDSKTCLNKYKKAKKSKVCEWC